MPLESGKSDDVVGRNIATEVNAGKPQKQAIAIAMSKAGRSKDAKDQQPAGITAPTAGTPGLRGKDCSMPPRKAYDTGTNPAGSQSPKPGGGMGGRSTGPVWPGRVM